MKSKFTIPTSSNTRQISLKERSLIKEKKILKNEKLHALPVKSELQILLLQDHLTLWQASSLRNLISPRSSSDHKLKELCRTIALTKIWPKKFNKAKYTNKIELISTHTSKEVRIITKPWWTILSQNPANSRKTVRKSGGCHSLSAVPGSITHGLIE